MENEMVEMRVNIAPEPRTPSRKPKARKGKTLFIVCILAIPILNWLVFWFWVNIQSILLAFQIETVDGISFGFTHFADFWEAIVKENGDLADMHQLLVGFNTRHFTIHPHINVEAFAESLRCLNEKTVTFFNHSAYIIW